MATINNRKPLKKYQEKNGMNQKALAKKLGITEAYLSYFFSGDRTFGAKTALRISKITGIKIEDLIQ